jgi:hypothetical protein
MNKLIGSVSANMSERRGYTIAVGPIGGICKLLLHHPVNFANPHPDRVDYLLYYYKYSSKAITDVCEEMLLQCWVISSPDVSDLDPNTLNVILQQGYAPKEGESQGDFNKRLEMFKQQVNKELLNTQVREAVLKHKAEAAIEALKP